MIDHIDRRLGLSDARIEPFEGLVDCGAPPDPALLADIRRICEEVGKGTIAKRRAAQMQAPTAPTLLLIVGFATASCTETSGVLQAGPDTYTISASARPVRGGAVGAQNAAISEATEFCAKDGKEMVVTHIESKGLQAQVTFRCVAKQAPRLQQP
jgi:hypothetical protein